MFYDPIWVGGQHAPVLVSRKQIKASEEIHLFGKLIVYKKSLCDFVSLFRLCKFRTFDEVNSKVL